MVETGVTDVGNPFPFFSLFIADKKEKCLGPHFNFICLLSDAGFPPFLKTLRVSTLHFANLLLQLMTPTMGGAF